MMQREKFHDAQEYPTDSTVNDGVSSQWLSFFGPAPTPVSWIKSKSKSVEHAMLGNAQQFDLLERVLNGKLEFDYLRFCPGTRNEKLSYDHATLQPRWLELEAMPLLDGFWKAINGVDTYAEMIQDVVDRAVAFLKHQRATSLCVSAAYIHDVKIERRDDWSDNNSDPPQLVLHCTVTAWCLDKKFSSKE
jgi:hypothetical protein